MVKRSAKVRMGGFWSFPAGKVDPEDSISEWKDEIKEKFKHMPDVKFRMAACREFAEETSVLLSKIDGETHHEVIDTTSKTFDMRYHFRDEGIPDLDRFHPILRVIGPDPKTKI